MTDRHTRDEPTFRINLDQQKKRAKDLLKALKGGDPAALERFRRNHPKAREGRSVAAAPMRLADAQFVIARELRLPGWPALKAHAAEMEAGRAAMERRDVLDRDLATLHIRCGSDVREALNAAGFDGDFLEYSNPFCQGPVVAGPDWLERRIAFVARSYAEYPETPEAEIRKRVEGEEKALAEAAARYERVVLWFEHDSYDQLILARCLACFAETGAPKVLDLVSVDRFPGSMRFIGIGQLPPEALRMLWERRTPVSGAAIDLGARVWHALRQPDPTALHEAARAGVPVLPQMAGAVRRHLQELPSTLDGTALTERIVLDTLTDGPMTMGRVYRDLMLEKEPLPWLGDLMFYRILQDMLRAEEPVIAVEPETADAAWPTRRIALSEAGRAVLAGTRDYLTLGPPERWVGGVRIPAGGPCWRWDREREAPL